MFHFVANLKDYTFHRGSGNRRFDAYLLSTDHVAGARHLLAQLHRERRTLCADNGNVAVIRALIAAHQPQAAALHHMRAEEEAAGASGTAPFVRPGDLSADLSRSFAEFAAVVRSASLNAVDEAHVHRVVTAQEAITPSYVIGMEDFTIAVLTSLGVEPEYSLLPPAFYRGLSERAVEFAMDTADGRYGAIQSTVFAGLHAIDLDTARAAGRAAGDAELAGIASGMVGALQDRTWIDYRVDNGQLLFFDRSVPRPYVRVMEIVTGLHLGFAERTGRRCRFHALGVGTPILMPLLGLLGDHATYTATDSTAPIVDGWIAPTIAFYVYEPAPLKYLAHRIAQFWIADDIPWDCPCPYCRRFTARHPPDIVRARAWWSAEGRPNLTAGMLSTASPLSESLPILGRPADTELRREAGLSRVGHNHWVLQRIERAIRGHGTNGQALRDWVGTVMEAYEESPALAAWKAAAHIAWQLADNAADALQGIQPQPLRT